MEAVKEITEWASGSQANHTYLLEGSTLVAYIPVTTGQPVRLRTPIRGFDRRGRKFVPVTGDPFGLLARPTTQIEVTGSKGQTYYVDPEAMTCTCPGYTFRGHCRHVEDVK
jgi:hypothetical protein